MVKQQKASPEVSIIFLIYPVTYTMGKIFLEILLGQVLLKLNYKALIRNRNMVYK